MQLRDDQQQAELLAELNAVEASVREAVREALLRHKRAGNPIAAWKDGKVQWVSADNIDLAEFEAAAADSASLSESAS